MTPQQQFEANQAKTEVELARDAADPTKTPDQRQAANAALKRLDQSKIAARPVTNINAAIPGLAGAATTKLTGEAFLATLAPGMAAQVRAMAEGRAALPSAASRSQGAQELRSAVFAYDPTYSDQKGQIRKAFTTGADGRNIASLNTATVHLDQLDDAAKALQNSKFTPINPIYNQVRSWTGSAVPTNFESVKAAVASEMASALKGNATDAEIGQMKGNLDKSNSWEQLHGAIETNLHVLGAKLQTYHERYQQQIPGDTTWSPVLPSARAVYDKHGMDPTAPPTSQPKQPIAQGGYQVGHLYSGMKYLGGDPNQKSSWQGK
jgi:hypothetical protein